MRINENKKGAVAVLVLSVVLFAAGCAGYFYYQLAGSGIFTMVMGLLCAAFCVRKIAQVGFLQIDDDGFGVQKGAKFAKFYFKDIEEISVKTIDAKRKIDVLSVKFKRAKLDRDAAYGLIQPIGDNDAVILDKYELSKSEIFRELKGRFENMNNIKKK
ncbi:molybdate transport repressor [Campylobacter curvus]|uniref:molybdate transport repressor n=1 Tax=Campylobacter curvus TaxID=200 RepID=UPI00146FD506|nr:molybdate transport repressor [Campylobacter curvus]